MPERSDWKVTATLDRDALVDDIAKLVGILKRQRIYCIVSAGNEEEARERGLEHLEGMGGISRRFIKTMRVRKLPT